MDALSLGGVMSFIHKNDKTLYGVVLTISLLVWVAVLILSFGLILIYVLFGFLGYLFVQSAFISHLRGNAVRLSESQFPDLHRQFIDSCNKLDMEPPEAYIMMSDGVLNALATKFLRRKYVVVYSSVLDALKSRPESVRFYFGHELAHIKRGHLNYQWLLFPGLFLPLLGTAYRRSQEYTCDLHGLAVSTSKADSLYALGVLGSGAEKLPALNLNEFMAQRRESGGFWMSFHELTSDYPWLCKRLAQVAGHDASPPLEENPRRNFFAWVLALFVPRAGIGGSAAGALMIIAIVGILAAIAIPAYQDYTIRGKVTAAMQGFDEVQRSAAPFVEEHGAYPENFEQIGVPEEVANSPYGTVAIVEEGLELTLHSEMMQMDGKTILYVAYRQQDQTIGWDCSGGTLEKKYRPAKCRR
jgi:Zn-dependent protease with chaperone function/Tfp pilus assembly protein PilE